MKDVRSYVNPFPPRFSADAQRAKLTGELYIEDRYGKQFDALLASVRKGSVVEVVELFLLAPTHFRPQKRRRLLAERAEAIAARGGSIREAASGWDTKKGHLPRMFVRAHEQIASTGRAGIGKAKSGRPVKWELTNHDREIIEMIWQSRRYKNDDERVVAVHKRTGKKLSRTWLYLHFGSPHGRPQPNYVG